MPKNQYFKDSNGDPKTPSDLGMTYITPEYAASLRWMEVDADYVKPQSADEKKAQAYSAINTTYNQKIRETTIVSMAAGVALDKQQTIILKIRNEWKEKLAEVANG